MLYELFIAGKPADLSENINIALSYTSIDCDTPTAEHGSYSKSVDLQGTKANNAIFGEIYDLSRTIFSDDYELGGIHFDARKRTEYKLWYNGNLLETGYIKLDSIKKTDGNITYSCTLYSDLGDFFYSLMYDANGNELTLADLNYGLKDVSGNTIDENNDTLFYWDKDYIYESWQALSGETEDSDRRVQRWITAAPTYGGYADDFDCSKVLVNTDSISGVTGATEDIMNSISASTVYSSGYAAYKGWMLTEATRDLDEWEVRDLRSVNQRPAIKMSLILDAISDKKNNGGFEVNWDDEIKNSPYYQNTYLVLNRLDFDVDEQANSINSVGCDFPDIPVSNSTFTTTTLYNSADSSVTTFDLSSYVSPRVSLGFDSRFTFDEVGASQVGTGSTLYTSYYQYWSNIFGPAYGTYVAHIFGGQVVRLSAWSGGTMLTSTPAYLTSTEIGSNTLNVEFGYKNPDWRERIKNQLGLQSGDDIVVRYDSIMYDTEARKYGWANPLQLDLDLPSEDGITLKLDVAWVWFSVAKNAMYGLAKMTSGEHFYQHFNFVTSNTILKNDDGYSTGIYNGTINPNIQKTNVTKDILFGESESPYKYLVGFTRMIGGKFRYDLAAKKIYIQTRQHYYLPEGHVIDGHIDRSKTIEIQPTLSEYKWCRYGFETPETYASILYKRKNKYEYGEKLVDTGYYFNADTNDLFEDIPYTNGIPFLQSSIYYSVYQDVPSIFVSPTFDVSLFKPSGDTIVDESLKIKGYASMHTVNSLKDSAGDKICCFDSDNSPVDDLTNCLLFYNGKKQTVDNYQISNNLPIMQTLNDNSCYIYVSGGTDCYPSRDASEKVNVCRIVNEIPVFSKYLSNAYGVYTDSLDFLKPNYTFIGNFENYTDGICLYDRYWKGYIEDLYEANNKAVTVRMFLKETPDVAMRKFYYFDNGIWVISEITDYDISKYVPTEVKFVKVYNTGNYVPETVVFDDMYDDWHNIEKEWEYRWVETSAVTCNGFDKVKQYKKQSRVIASNTDWADVVPEVLSIDGNGTMPIIIEEKNSLDCDYIMYRWVLSDLETTCSGVDKYKVYIYQQKVGHGDWEDVVPEVTSIDADGTEEPVLIERNSFECGYVQYYWKVNTGQTTCSGVDKYYLYQLWNKWYDNEHSTFYDEPVEPAQYSINGNGTETPQLAEANSYDCGYEYYYWDLTQETTCSGTDKYYLYQLWYKHGVAGLVIDEPVEPYQYSIDGEGTMPLQIAQWCSSDCGGGKITIWTTTTSITECFENGIAPDGYYSGRTDIIKAEVEPTMNSVSNRLFKDCTNMSAVTFNGTGTFYAAVCQGCASLRNVSIGTGYTQMQGWTFSGCTSLSSITIPDNITLIGGYSFANCPNLKQITFGSGLTQLNLDMFSGDTSLSSITCDATTAPVLQDRVFKGIKSTGTLYYPCDSDYSTWLAALPSGWTDYCHQWVATSATTCSGVNSYYLYKLQVRDENDNWVDVVPEVLSIDGNGKMPYNLAQANSFGCGYVDYRWTASTDEIICSGVNSYYAYKLQYMSGLTGELIWRDVEPEVLSIDADGTETPNRKDWCSSECGHAILESYNSANTKTTYCCENGIVPYLGPSDYRVKAIVKEPMVALSGKCFTQNIYLSSVTLPDTLVDIGDGAFKSCVRLKSINIPSGVTHIGSSGFSNCTALSSVTIPSVSSVPAYGFYQCTGLKEVTFANPNSVKIIGVSAFTASQISSITIPDSVREIGQGAFGGSYGYLKEMVIGSGITYLALNSLPSGSLNTCTFRSMSPPDHGGNFHLYSDIASSGQRGTLYLPVGSDFSSWFAGSNSVFGTNNWDVVYYNLT